MKPPTLTRFQSLPDVRSMGRQLFDPVWAEKAHRSGSCELLHVIQGNVRVEIGRRHYEGGPGHTLLIPGGTRHRDRFDVAQGLDVFMILFTWTAEAAYFAAVPPHAPQSMPAPAIAEINRLLEHLQTDLVSGTEADRLVARAHVLTLLLLVLRHVLSTRPSGGGRRAAAYGQRHRQQLMLAAKRYLDAHLADPVSLDGIARALGVSPYYLSHVFTQESDFSLFEYLTTLRMQRARDLLREGRRNVSEVAYAVGYEDSNYFSKVFRRHFGQPPRNCLALAQRPAAP